IKSSGHGITDLAGNPLSGAPSDVWTKTSDVTAPTADIVDVTPDPRNTAEAWTAVGFREAEKGFDRGDLILDRAGDGLGRLLNAAQTLTTADNKTWPLGNLSPLTGNTGVYTLSFKSSGTGITDLVGNPLAGAPSDVWTKQAAALALSMLEAQATLQNVTVDEA